MGGIESFSPSAEDLRHLCATLAVASVSEFGAYKRQQDKAGVQAWYFDKTISWISCLDGS